MAFETKPIFESAQTAADLSASQFRCVREDGAGKMVVAANGSSAIAGILGHHVEDGSSDDKTVQVGTSGVVKGQAGAAIAAGAPVTGGTGGKLVTASGAGVHFIGFAKEAASADLAVIPIRIDRGVLHA